MTDDFKNILKSNVLDRLSLNESHSDDPYTQLMNAIRKRVIDDVIIVLDEYEKMTN